MVNERTNKQQTNVSRVANSSTQVGISIPLGFKCNRILANLKAKHANSAFGLRLTVRRTRVTLTSVERANTLTPAATPNDLRRRANAPKLLFIITDRHARKLAGRLCTIRIHCMCVCVVYAFACALVIARRGTGVLFLCARRSRRRDRVRACVRIRMHYLHVLCASVIGRSLAFGVLRSVIQTSDDDVSGVILRVYTFARREQAHNAIGRGFTVAK